jgi:hypothetical protein
MRYGLADSAACSVDVAPYGTQTKRTPEGLSGARTDRHADGGPGPFLRAGRSRRALSSSAVETTPPATAALNSDTQTHYVAVMEWILYDTVAVQKH